MAAKSIRRRMRTAMLVGIVGSLVAGACSSDHGSTRSSTPTSGTVGTTDTVAPGASATGTFGLRLSEGTAQAAAAQPVPVLDGTPLSQAEADAIFARLPEWRDDGSLATDFAWPAQTLPPPRTGAVVDVPFPAAEAVTPPAVAGQPLEVLRYQPEGEVAVAPFISVTFNQPMVQLGTVDQVDGTNVPVTITPPIDGTWHWIGTRTLRFDASSDLIDRLPMATEYHVEIPAGTVSPSGGTLAQAVAWDFATPPVTVQSFQPQGDSQPLEPVFLATFDQRVDADAVLQTVTATANGKAIAVRRATDAEVAADESVQAIVERAPEARWLAFVPVDPLPADSAVTVAIGAGTPSAEGPRTTTDPATYSLRTYAPLRVGEVSCTFGASCPPGSDIYIEFNNALDVDKFDPAAVTITPELKNAVISANGPSINIRGTTVGRTTYTIGLPAGLTDVFGQTLGKDATVTVDIGEARPVLGQFSQPLTTLDPLAKSQSLAVTTVNHADLHVQVFAVTPADWGGYLDYAMRTFQGDSNGAPRPDWPVLLDTKIKVAAQQDQLVETAIDLSSALKGKPGHVVVIVEPTTTYDTNSEDYYNNRPTITWAQSTAIGVDGIADADQLLIWTTDLSSGAPLPSVAVTLIGSNTSVTTGTDGLAMSPLPAVTTTALLATKGDDTALLPSGYYGEGWSRSRGSDEARWYVFDDRQMYRPGETVSVKGWVRRLTTSTDGQITAIGDGASVDWTAHDSQGNELATGTAAVNLLGGFTLTFDVPAGANLGYSSLDLQLKGAAGIDSGFFTHGFQLQEFRRPEFETTARVESAQPQLSTKPATLAVAANYYAGGPLANAAVDWTVTTSAATYAPPNWDGFSFGIWTPWWLAGDVAGGDAIGTAGPIERCCFPPGGDSTVKQYSGTTDAAGNHYLQIDFEKPEGGLPDLPVLVNAQAAVQDINRQTLSSGTNLLVHPGQFYVGLRSSRTFVRQGEPLNIDAIVTDIDGTAVAGRSLTVTASRLDWQYVKGTWTQVALDPQTCPTTSAAEPVTCTFTAATGGQYTISATIADDQGGKSRSELTTWVSGGDAIPSRALQQEALTIVPDQQTYAPGDSAELLVQAPFSTGEGLATVTRNKITSTIRFQVTDGSAIVKVPVTDADIPNVDVAIEVVGATTRTADDGTALADAPQRPAFATGTMTLSIPPASRTLAVAVTPAAATVTPGAATSVNVAVNDASGAPVAGAEMAVVVVDEAVLALSGYTLTNPLDTFYSQLYTYLSTVYGRSTIVLDNPAGLTGDGDKSTANTEAAADTAAPAATIADGVAAPVADAGRNSAGGAPEVSTGGTPIDVRTNFDALAVFQPEVTTDATGKATVAVPLPDNLTRYRVMVVAVAGDKQFGSGESNITARLPLMVRPSAPRFLNFGDTIELPVVLQNQTDQPMDVSVGLQTANLTNTGVPGKLVTVPANDRVEVRFEVAASQAGAGRFRVAAVSGDAADAATIELPVYTPATAEAFATYGVIDDGAITQPVLAPTEVVPQFGGLDITTSSTALQALTDAVIYINDYPYASSDALASRILSIAALRDVLDAFDAPGLPTPEVLNATVTGDIAALVALQHDDGGFGYWTRVGRSDPYNTIQAVHALVMARTAGYTVPTQQLEFALSYLADIESHYPAEYSQDIRDSLSSYALSVRNLAGTRDTAKAQALYARSSATLQLDAIAWLWPLIDDSTINAEIEKLFNNRAVETAGAANFSTSYGDDAYLILHSDRRTDGIILDALLTKQPSSDLIPKVVTGLLGNQVKGRWDNIQENAFILLALKHYFDVNEGQTPDFVARAWLGDRYAGDHTFSGRSTDRVLTSIPTAALIEAGNSNIVLSKEGVGRLYYRLGLRYAPSNLQLTPLDRGFVVTRTYEGVDDPADVTQDADGTWHIKAGARVRVRLQMVAESQRTHVALIDPLPAGLEILNPALATTEALPTDPTTPDVPVIDGGFDSGIDWTYPWWGVWFDHQNMRDDRAEAFATLLPGGTYDYSYIARATTPGAFIAPPARAEEMYAPETFGRGQSDAVVIGD